VHWIAPFFRLCGRKGALRCTLSGRQAVERVVAAAVPGLGLELAVRDQLVDDLLHPAALEPREALEGGEAGPPLAGVVAVARHGEQQHET